MVYPLKGDGMNLYLAEHSHTVSGLGLGLDTLSNQYAPPNQRATATLSPQTQQTEASRFSHLPRFPTQPTRSDPGCPYHAFLVVGLAL
jgi:hypothetical protein